jgi:uncharacterized membrane protein YgdD (TMEM256/DUF423 family)
VTERHLIIAAALVLLTGVAAGAFGAHGLKRILSPDELAIWHTAVLYQMVHGLGMLALASLIGRLDGALAIWSGNLMLAGILVFSGSLYLLTLTGIKWLGAVTPIGGTAFIAAWALLALAAYRSA